MPDFELTLSHVSKSFKGKKILDDLSFSVPSHSVYGFIGQNGAGKTTTMKLILGLLAADEGEIFVMGEKVRFGDNRTNRSIGYLPDVPEFYGYMTPSEYLSFCGEITGLSPSERKSRSAELLELVGLTEAAGKPTRTLSRGMKQRLGIAQALLNRPRLLLCDEPTSALDPVGRKEILDLLLAVREKTTVLFSTHILSDVERICDNIAFLHNGKIAREGSLEEVRGRGKKEQVEIEFLTREEAGRFASLFPNAMRKSDLSLLLPRMTEEEMIALVGRLGEEKFAFRRLERLEPSLEELFLEVVGQ